MTEEYERKLNEKSKEVYSLSKIKELVEANKMTKWRRFKLLFFAKLANKVMGLVYFLSGYPCIAMLLALKFNAYIERKRAALRPKPIIFNGQVQNAAVILDLERQMKEQKRKEAEERDSIERLRKELDEEVKLFRKAGEESMGRLATNEGAKLFETKINNDQCDYPLPESLTFKPPLKPLKVNQLPQRPWNSAVPVETNAKGDVLGEFLSDLENEMEEFLADEDFKEIKPRKKAKKVVKKTAKKAKKSTKKGKKKQ